MGEFEGRGSFSGILLTACGSPTGDGCSMAIGPVGLLFNGAGGGCVGSAVADAMTGYGLAPGTATSGTP